MPIIANFGGGGSKTDATLTKLGLPADAKATGDALDNLKDYADSIIQISDTEPTDPNTEIWVNPSDGDDEGGATSPSIEIIAHNLDENSHADIRAKIDELNS